jgi:hypothetical protein
MPVPGDYNGNGHAQVAIFRPSTSEWWLRNDNGSATRIVFGGRGDQPIPAIFAIRFGM